MAGASLNGDPLSFLQEIGLGQYYQKFVDEKLTSLDILLELNEQDLKDDLAIPTLGERKLIMKTLNQIRNNASRVSEIPTNNASLPISINNTVTNTVIPNTTSTSNDQDDYDEDLQRALALSMNIGESLSTKKTEGKDIARSDAPVAEVSNQGFVASLDLISLGMAGPLLSLEFLPKDSVALISRWCSNKSTSVDLARDLAKKWLVNIAGACTGAAAMVSVFRFVSPASQPIAWALSAIAGIVGIAVGEATTEKVYDRLSKKIFEWIKDRKVKQVLREAYEFLGVSSDVPNSVIQRAYIKLAKVYHPDRAGGNHEMMVKLSFYMEIIKCHRLGKSHFEDHYLLLGYK